MNWTLKKALYYYVLSCCGDGSRRNAPMQIIWWVLADLQFRRADM